MMLVMGRIYRWWLLGGMERGYLARFEQMMAGTLWMNCSSPLMVCSLRRAYSFNMEVNQIFIYPPQLSPFINTHQINKIHTFFTNNSHTHVINNINASDQSSNHTDMIPHPTTST